MQRVTTPIENTDERGGGKNTAAPFWALLALAVLTVFWLSYLFLGTRDTLISLVPSDAAAYIHDQDGAADIVQKLQPQMGQLTPTETALFAVNSDGGLQWTTLLRWNFPAEISNEERKHLAEGGAIGIDDRTYAFGATEFVLPKNTDESLATNPIAAPALRNLRGVARVQGYLASTPVGQMAHLLSAGADDDKNTAIPYAFAVTNHEKTQLILVKAEEATSWLGFKLNTSNSQPLLPLLIADDELEKSAAYSINNNDFNLTSSIFSQIEMTRRANGVPDSHELTTAKQQLAELLSDRLAFTLGSDYADNTMQFVVLLPDTDYEQLQNALNRLTSAAQPTQKEFIRPDNLVETEYVLDSVSHDFAIKHSKYGIIFSSSQDVLVSVWKSLSTTADQPESCAPGAQDLIRLHNLQFVGDYFPILSLFLNYPQLENGVIQRNGDNYVIFCG